MQTATTTPKRKKEKKYNVKLSFKKTQYCERSEWVSFYPTIDKLCFKVGLGSYFDERIQINSHITTIIAIIGLFIQPWLSLWFIPLWILCLAIPFGHFFLNLPIYTGINDCDYPEYGFYFYSERPWMFTSIWLCWDEEKYAFYMPWDWEWYRTSALLKDGTWEHSIKWETEKKHFYEDKWQDKLWKESFPYTYVLRNGKKQERIASVKVEEMEWRWKGLLKLPLIHKTRKSLCIEFNEEIGEETGSWKGGTVGCSYSMLHGELPIHTLRRMEKERKFKR